MDRTEQFLNEKLTRMGLISPETSQEIKDYQAKNIFSLHNELLTLLYVSIILFTSGIGVIIYNNIDSIGHVAILCANFVLMATCFYLAFKKCKGWSKQEVLFDNSLYDYVVLLGSILATIFLGYLQFQYKIFGTNFGLVSLFSAILCFGIAYFFDNKIVLSIAISALATCLGLSLSYNDVFSNDLFNNIQLTMSALILGLVFLLWIYYCDKNDLKKHFYFIFLTFAFHLIGLSCISGLLSNYWFLFAFITVGFVYYFYKISKETFTISIYVFCLLYAFVGINIMIFKLFELTDADALIESLLILSPIYYIGSIVLFIRLIMKFNKEKNASLQ